MFGSVSMATVVVGVLGVWRVTHLFWGEDGPGDVFVKLRRAAGSGFWGKLLDCFYCMSLWVAVPFAWVLADLWMERAVLWLALSGGAILLERATSKQAAVPPPVVWREEPMPTDVDESPAGRATGA